MPYITYEDYVRITGDSSDCPDFDAICALAESEIDAHTLYGYVGRDISAMPPYITEKLQQTVAYQAQYIITQGGVEGTNDAGGDFGSVSLGEYSYSLSASGRTSDGSSSASGVMPLSKAAAVNIPLLCAYARGLRKL